MKKKPLNKRDLRKDSDEKNRPYVNQNRSRRSRARERDMKIKENLFSIKCSVQDGIKKNYVMYDDDRESYIYRFSYNVLPPFGDQEYKLGKIKIQGERFSRFGVLHFLKKFGHTGAWRPVRIK